MYKDDTIFGAIAKLGSGVNFYFAENCRIIIRSAGILPAHKC